MLKLYNLKKEKIEGLTKYKNLTRERDLKKGEDTLSFSYPKKLAKNIKEECYIETKFNFYVIKEIDNSSGDWIGVVAKVNIEGLKSNSFPHFEMINSYLKDTLSLALAGTGWTIGHNDIAKRRTVRVSNKTSLEIVDEIRRVYKAEIFFDAINKKINVYEKLGKDKGDFFMEDVNLKSLSISSDSYDYVTRLIPLGKDGLTIKDVNNGKEYVENYQYSNKIIYATWEDNRYTIVENLKQDAIEKLDELSKPYKSYEADVVDLRGADLGDTITLISKENGVKEKQRVVKITEYPDEPWKNKTEIANKAYTFEEMQNDIIETVDTADTVLTSDGMVDDSKVNFNPIRQEFVTIIAEKADIVDLNAAVIRVGELEATKANLTDLEAVNARIDELDVGDLTAVNAEIEKLKVGVGSIEHLLAGNITTENIAAGAITAGSGIIAEGAIGDAEISDLTAGKIRAGTLDTSLVTVAGADGKLNITGNRLQVIHEGLERVALGDVNRDGSVYGLRVRGADGETVLFDDKGVTKEGITDGAIDDSKVSDDANIQGYKLDINSVIREVNDVGTETIKETRVQVGDRTLDVVLSTQKSLIDDNTTEISNQRTQISALDDSIRLKVDNQEFNQYKTITDENITTINTQLSKNTSSINILQEEINLKVSQTDVEKLINEIEIGGRNLLRGTSHNYESAVLSGWGDYPYREFEAPGGETITARVYVKPADEPTSIQFVYRLQDRKTKESGAGNFINPGEEGYASKTHTVPKNIKHIRVQLRHQAKLVDKSNTVYYKEMKVEKGEKMTDWSPAPEDIESEITKINSEVAEININLDSITSRVSSTESNITKINNEVSTIESRVSIAEQKITPNAIVNTVRESTAYQGDMNQLDLKISTVEQTTDNLKISVGQYNDGVLTGATYTFDGNNAIFKGAGFKIQNQAGDDVLVGDTQGSLSLSGQIKTYMGDSLALHMFGQRMRFYDWEGTTRKYPVGEIFTERHRFMADKPGIMLTHETDAFMSIAQTVYGGYQRYMDFDMDNLINSNVAYPIRVWEKPIFYQKARFQDSVAFGATNQIYETVDGALMNWVDGSIGTGYRLFSTREGVFQYAIPNSHRAQFLVNTSFDLNAHVNGVFTVSGKKNALHKTENYGERLINAYETTEYYFADIGSGKIGEDGFCYIYIDDIFGETVNTEMNYHIFYGKHGQGDLWVKGKTPKYFVMEGTPNLEFTWELKAKRDGCEYDRLEQPENYDNLQTVDNDLLTEDGEQEQKTKELTNIVSEELDFDLTEFVTKEGD